MDDQGERRRVKPETFVRSGLTSSCATPRHQWRSPTWNPTDKPDTPFTRFTPPPPTPVESDFANSSDVLCPPMGTLSVNDQAQQHQPQGSVAQGKKKLPIRLDLGAITNSNLQFHEQSSCSSPELSESDNELRIKREKLAECDRQCTRIMGHLYFGSKTVAENYAILRRFRITHILNCVGMVCPSYFPNDFFYKTLFLQDTPSEDLTCILYDVFDFIEDVREQAGGRVFVHCCQGVSRSASLVIAYVMWRERRSFDQVYSDVKQRRGVTCPNIGFVFQLTQWQNRVLCPVPQDGIPPAKVYRMAPQSQYCPLQLVPRLVPGPATLDVLDSRGVFVLQLPSRLYVWRGRGSDKAMAAAAERAAFQLVRYEHAQGPIVVAVEGREPPFLLNALRREHLVSGPDVNPGVQRGQYAAQIQHAGKAPFGLKLVSAYDPDFEMYSKGRTTGGGALTSDLNVGLQPSPTPAYPASPRVGRWRMMRPQVSHIATRW